MLACIPANASYCYCEYDYWDYRGYGCVAKNVNFNNEFDNLIINGDHFPLDNDASVRAVTFQNSKVNFVPAAILEKFKNLDHLVLNGVSLLAPFGTYKSISEQL